MPSSQQNQETSGSLKHNLGGKTAKEREGQRAEEGCREDSTAADLRKRTPNALSRANGSSRGESQQPFVWNKARDDCIQSRCAQSAVCRKAVQLKNYTLSYYDKLKKKLNIRLVCERQAGETEHWEQPCCLN